MVKKLSSALLAALLLGATSCSDDNPWMGETGKGGIKLILSMDTRVKDAIAQTRATEVEGSEYFEIPAKEDFKIVLEKVDGTMKKEYRNLEHFAQETSFAAGQYKLSALYGDINVEGYKCPHFSGIADVTVFEGQTTEVELIATLANSLFTIEYSDEFKKYFTNYSTTLHSNENSYVKIDPDEADTEGASFVAPGEVSMIVNFTNHQGQSVSISPASVYAEPGHHYNVTMNVSGQGYDAKLEIKFDDNLTQEQVTVDLTNELFTSPAPKINPYGFVNTDPVSNLDFLRGNASDEKLKCDVISYGGLQEVILTLKSESFRPAFGNEIELIGANAAQQEQLSAIGFNIKGIFCNPDRMAIVDFSEVPAHLPEGSYEISLVAKDKLMRVSEPVSVKLNIISAQVKAEPGSALLGINRGTLTIEYNGSHPENDLTFQAMDAYGIYKPCTATFVKATRTRAFEMETYTVTLNLPDFGSRTTVPVRVFLFETQAAQVELPVEVPEFTLEPDAFATKVRLKVKADDDQIPVIVNYLKLTGVDGTVERDPENGLITISGLTPNKDYTVTPSILTTTGTAVSFHTEEDKAIENGDFSQTTQTIKTDKIDAGGKYNFSVGIIRGTYQNKSYIEINTPDYWGNINNITCNLSSSRINTWYVVPSTLSVENGVKIRTVGYNDNGPEIPTGNATALNYYSPVAPSAESFKKAAGQLFYGSKAENGASFTSRPSAVEFSYLYAPLGGESAGAKVIVYSGDTRIGEGNLSVNNTGGTAIVPIRYYTSSETFGKKATRIAIVFVSSTSSDPTITIPSGSDLKDNNANAPDAINWGSTLSANTYKSLATGSELTINSVKLNY